MNNNPSKFRLRLNLFDCIILLIAIVAAGFLLWNRLAPDETGPVSETKTVQYTIRICAAQDGTGDYVQEGDKLVDAVKNFELGKVVSFTVSPARRSILDESQHLMVIAEVPNRQDIELVMTATSTGNDAQLLVGSGYELRVGEPIYVRGPGYMGSGYVIAIERGA